MVAYLGNVSNFLAQAPGTQITISNFNSVQLSNMCPDGLGNLQWSVFASFQGTISNSSGVWPRNSCWYTVPRTNAGTQTTPLPRLPSSTESFLEQNILSVGSGANDVSQVLITTQGNTNINNNSLVVLEPVNLRPADNLTAFIGDSQNPNFGDFQGTTINFSVENTTPDNFNAPSVSDFYVNVPYSTVKQFTYIDPLTGLANGTADYLGYFTLNPNGTMTFTRATSGGGGTPPVAGFSGAPLVGFAPLQVTFTDASTGTITNWVWNFGDGQSVTNSTSASVNHTFTTAGNYTVSLTANGPGGTDTKVLSAYLQASSTPQLAGVSVSGGNLAFSGSNCPAGVQYRILASTNLSLNQWQPVATNTFLNDGTFHFTNSTATGRTMFFRLVSP